MNLKRFSEILEAYGGDSRRWPESERISALELCSKEPEARRMMEDTLALDVLLDSHEITSNNPIDLIDLIRKIESRIQHASNQSGQNIVDQFIGWLIPDLRSMPSLFRPALVACLPILLGIWIGTGESTTDELTLDEEYVVLAVFTTPENEGL